MVWSLAVNPAIDAETLPNIEGTCQGGGAAMPICDTAFVTPQRGKGEGAETAGSGEARAFGTDC